MSAKCANCGYDAEPDPPRAMCPHCGDDGYSDWEAHRAKPRRERPVYDDSQSFDLREVARERRDA